VGRPRVRRGDQQERARVRVKCLDAPMKALLQHNPHAQGRPRGGLHLRPDHRRSDPAKAPGVRVGFRRSRR
jgi:hypothetical protein